MLLYIDSSPRRDVASGSKAALASVNGSQSFGTLRFTTEQHRGLRGTIQVSGQALAGVGTVKYAVINVPTTWGNEIVSCGPNSDGSLFCDGPLFGAPLVGATTILAVNGAPLAKGTIQ